MTSACGLLFVVLLVLDEQADRLLVRESDDVGVPRGSLGEPREETFQQLGVVGVSQFLLIRKRLPEFDHVVHRNDSLSHCLFSRPKGAVLPTEMARGLIDGQGNISQPSSYS